jgi:hypothetical protein
MIRETLEADSRHALVALTPSNRAQFAFRAGIAGAVNVTSTAKDSFNLPHWIRLTRAGALFRAEHSSDGTNWMPVESSDPVDPSQFQIPLPSSLYIGLAVSANREDGTPCEVVFSNVTITGGTTPGPLA